jgi:uncharacterized membrane protein
MTGVKLNWTLTKVFPWLLVIAGIIGLFASFTLSYDTLAIHSNPNYIPSCNLNPVISCGDVITFKGDSIFGLPYPFYGIAAFAVVLTIGVGMLANAKFSKWFWLSYQTFLTLGLAGAYYLLLKSIYQIHALCPYCLTIDVVTTTLFWYSTLFNADKGLIDKRLPSNRWYKLIRKHHLDILILAFVILAAAIIKHFWYYYGKHLF